MIQNGSATTLNFTKDSSNSQTVTLNNTQAYNGTTTLIGGVLSMGSIASSTGGFASNSSLNLTTGWLDLNQKTVTVANLDGTGGGLESNNGRGTLILNDSGGPHSFTGNCGNNTNFALTKNGSSTLTISNLNFTTGLLTINGGTVKVTGTTNSPPVTVSGASSVLDFPVSSGPGIGALTLDSGGSVIVSANTPHLYLGGAANCIKVTNPPAGGSTINLNGGILDFWSSTAYITVARGSGANDLTVTNYQYIYNNSNPWHKAGAGVLLLNNPSSNQQWNGALYLDGGTVKCGNNNALDINQVVYMADGTTLDLNGQSPTCGNLGDNGTVSGTAVVTSSASGTMTLTIHQNFFGHLQRRDPERQRHDVEFHQGLQQ